jgi:WD40 repeat protein
MDDAKTNDLGAFSLAVDIWSVGAVAFKMVTSRLPFSEPGQLFNYVVHQTPFPIEELMTANCAKFIADAMAPSPRRRPTSRAALSYDWLQRQDQTTTQEYVAPNPNIELGPVSPVVPEASARWTTISEIPTSPIQIPPPQETIPNTAKVDPPPPVTRFPVRQNARPINTRADRRNKKKKQAGEAIQEKEKEGELVLDKPVDDIFQSGQALQPDQAMDPMSSVADVSGSVPLNDGVVHTHSSRKLIINSHLPKWQTKQTLKHNGQGCFIKFSPDGRLVASGVANSGAPNAMVMLLEADQNGAYLPVQELWNSDARPFLSVAFSCDGCRIVSTSASGKTVFWESDQHGRFQVTQELGGITPDAFWLSTLALSQNGQEIVVLLKAGGGILHWKANATPVDQHIGRGTHYRFVAFSPDGRWIASGPNTGRIDVWKVDSQGIFHQVQQLKKIGISVFPRGSELQSVQFSSDGRRIACGRNEGSILIWEFDPKGKLHLIQELIHSPPLISWPPPLINWPLASLMEGFSWDRQVVASHDRSTVRIYFASEQGKIRNFTKLPLDGHILAVNVLPDGVRCISRPYQASETLYIWALNFANPGVSNK